VDDGRSELGDGALIYEAVMEWSKYRDFILPSLVHSHGSHNEDDIISGVLQGDDKGGFKLWKGDGAAIISHFIQFPQMKILNVWLGGGDLKELLKMEPQISAYAKANGCAQVRGGGRAGWTKALPSYEQIGIVMYKEI